MELLASIQLPHNPWIEHVTFSPDGQWLATCAASSLQIYQFGPENKTSFSKYANFTPDIDEVLWKSSFHPKEAFICTVSSCGMLNAYDIHNKSNIYSKKVFNYVPAFGLCFHPNGEILAVCGLNKHIKLCKYLDGSIVQSLSGHLNSIEDVQFSPDGSHLASCSKDTTIKIWHKNNSYWANRHTLQRHSKWVFSCSFSPNSKLLATASADRKIGIWQVCNGDLLRFLHGHSNIVWAVCFLDDTELVSCSSDGSLRYTV